VAGSLNDLDYVKTDGYEVEFNAVDALGADSIVAEGWYNQTFLEENAQRSGKRQQIPFLDRNGIILTTEANNFSTGYSYAMTWGDEGGDHISAGTDLRYLNQEMNEFSEATQANPISGMFVFGMGQTNVPIPESHWSNPGLFVEGQRQVGDRVTVRAGSRFDWVSADATNDADGAFATNPANNVQEFFGVDSLDREFEAVSVFLTADMMINENWTLVAGGSYAMRPPTLYELYSAAPFVLTIPQFATSAVFGSPNLDKEERQQVDLGFRAEYCRSRFGATGYFAQIRDYITVDRIIDNSVDPLDTFPIFGFVNTERATLAGFEAYGEYDVNRWLTAFGNLSYTEGRDHTADDNNYFGDNQNFDFSLARTGQARKQPLPVISPMEGRVGIRLKDPNERRFGVELSARIVDNQDRFAAVLGESATPGFTTYDVRTFYQASNKLSFVAGVENFTDKFYQEHLDARNVSQVFRPGINFYAGSELQY